jgi:hypothetical protein
VEDNAYIGSVLAGLGYLAVGARLVRLSIRTRSASEWVLGLAFLIWSLSYALWVTSVASQGQPALESQLLIASRLATTLGGVGIAFFPLLAFRRGSTWAKWLSASIAICLIVGRVGSSWVGDPEGLEPLTNVWWWFDWFGEIAPAIWIGVEGLHHYGTTRPRVQLGLCEPIVGQRYLLWGIAGVFWTLLDFVVVGQFVEFWVTRTWSATMDYLIGFCEIAALAMIWLAYFAPATYRRWVARSASVANPEESRIPADLR